MPNQTIDLWNGLEAWYDLDPRYYDNQRGVLADKSGHGRVAEASGGPTVGVEGPNDFQATSFDGNDDYLQSSVSDIRGASEHTSHILLRVNDSGASVVFNISNNFHWGVSIDGSGNLRVFAESNDNFDVESLESVNAKTYSAVTIVWDNGVHKAFVDGELVHYNDEFTTDVLDDDRGDGKTLTIGSDNSLSNFGAVDIAFAADWTRALSYSEIQEIARLTAPPRSL